MFYFQVTSPVLVLGVPVFAVYVVVASQMAKLHGKLPLSESFKYYHVVFRSCRYCPILHLHAFCGYDRMSDY